MPTEHVEAHEVGVVSQAHGEADDEEGGLAEAGGERGGDAGHQQQDMNEHQRLKQVVHIRSPDYRSFNWTFTVVTNVD